MHKGGARYGSGGSLDHKRGGGRRGGRGGRGGQRHPSGLSGKAIGLWYAARSKEKKRNTELQEHAVVTMSHQREERINRLLGDLRHPSDTDARHQMEAASNYYSAGQSQWHNHQNIKYESMDGVYGSSRNQSKQEHVNIKMEPLYDSAGQSQWYNHQNIKHESMDGIYGSSRNQSMQEHVNIKMEPTYDIQHQCRTQERHADWHRNIDEYATDRTRQQGEHSCGAGTDSTYRDSVDDFAPKHTDRGKQTMGVPHSSTGALTFDAAGGSLYDDDYDYFSGDESIEGDMLCVFDEMCGGQNTAASKQHNPPSIKTPPLESSPLQRDSALDERLKNELSEKKVANRKYIEMQEFRKKLPSFQMNEKLLHVIGKGQVVVISGETGCGKTTQVAQFILDEAIASGNGSLCRIACTQPRRISAISVAERVASERGEQCGNGSVGYQIRLDSKLPRTRGSIIYCTTGVLLRWLVSDPLLQSTSHVIIDEIHERDLMSDFLLIIVKDLLYKRPDLKLILMSATLNAEMFSSFFGDCPMAHIPGFTYAVNEFYIEEVIEMTKYQVNPSSQNRAGSSRGRGGGPKWKKYRRRKSPAKDRRAQKMAFDNEEGDDEQELFDEEVQWREYLHSIQPRFSHSTVVTLENMDLEKIDIDLAVRLIQHICLNMEDGAILVFMPGWDDISKLHGSLKKSFTSDKFVIIPLHSMMPTANQHQVFDRPPPGVRKIIIATNIAETSITIDDVVFVVDCGKVKEKSYDVSRKISCLMPVWISQASSRQRRGRAGRVQPGYCFHLFTELRSQSLIDYQLPEMLRTPLEELCLQIKILNLGMVGEFLSKALQPPAPQAVQNALDVLKQLNAIDVHENLTPLGHHLATLPVDPRIGKMILFGAILSCLDPVLTVASTLGFKEPFVSPLEKKMQADKVRTQLAGNTFSDHLAVLNAYQGWESAKRHGNESAYCWENFLSMQTLKMLSNMKVQFARLLCDIGFLDSLNPKDEAANYNADNLKLVKAVLCAGLYPNVVKIEHHTKLKRAPRMFTQEDGKVALHPKSVNVKVSVFENDWLIYHQKVKSTKVFIHDCTMIAPYPLLFFGGNISVLMEEGHEIIAVDNFIRFRSPRRIANLVKELRKELDKLLERKIAHPGLRLSVGPGSDSAGSSLLRAIIDLITSEESTNWKRRRAMEQGENRR